MGTAVDTGGAGAWTSSDDVERAVRRAAVLARQAPSIHNTQPWSFVAADRSLLVRADWARQLAVFDPTGRQLLLSCGCAVFNARVALAAAGTGVVVGRACDDARPPVAAALHVDPAQPADPTLAALDEWVPRRHTNRRRFAPDPVDPAVVERLQDAAAVEGAVLHEVVTDDDRLAVARLSQRAERLADQDPAHRAELRRWTADDVLRPDGVAVPGPDPTVFLLGTRAHSPAAWERAGEALQRVWLELTRAGYVASPLTQVVEQPLTRAELRTGLRLGVYPHVLLRVGRAAPTPATRRRRLSDLLVHAR